MPAAAAPFMAAVLMLGLAGVAKLIRPNDTARALQDAGLRLGPLRPTRTLIRVGSAAELVVAACAFAFPGPVTGALVAVAYVAFAIFVITALRRGWALSSCGCFAKPDTRPSYLHSALNLGAAAAAVAWAVSAPDRLGRPFDRSPWHGSALGIVVVVIAGLAYAIWTNPVEAAR